MTIKHVCEGLVLFFWIETGLVKWQLPKGQWTLNFWMNLFIYLFIELKHNTGR
jgi:hypothetical protein